MKSHPSFCRAFSGRSIANPNVKDEMILDGERPAQPDSDEVIEITKVADDLAGSRDFPVFLSESSFTP